MDINNNYQKSKQQILIFLEQYKPSNTYSSKNDMQQNEIYHFKLKGYDKHWPLHYAAISSDIEQINLLCQNINVDQKTTHWGNKTPITYAARYGIWTVRISN